MVSLSRTIVWLLSLQGGVMAGMFLSLAGASVFLAVRVLREPRMDRLMVTFYDALNEESRRAAEAQEAGSADWHDSVPDCLVYRVIRWTHRNDYALRAKSDGECIVSARKFLKRQRRLSLFLVGFAVLYAVAFFYCLCGVICRNESAGPIAFLAGLVFGSLILTMLLGAALHWEEALWSLRSPRVARLMLRFHDALHREQSRSTQDIEDTREASGPCNGVCQGR